MKDLDVDTNGRLVFQEVMSLVPLPSNEGSTKRYMSHRRAWSPESDILIASGKLDPAKQTYHKHLKSKVAYGGHVYSQAGLAASKAFAEIQASQKDAPRKKFGIHTIHGYFSEAGLIDKPFIYHVTTVAPNPGFHNLLVTVRQPISSSTNESGDHFPLEDANLPLGPVCFNALVSFRPTVPSQHIAQEISPQKRFADVLSSRPPSEWDYAPHVDIAKTVESHPMVRAGSFPLVDMRKVDLSTFNEGKSLHERRELILYRLLAPLPADDPNAHICTHAYEADRNGLLMIGNHVGFGHDFGRAASLSYSFIVHVNPQDAVMSHGDDEWWIQEACFPRVEAGRGVIMSKIWSPSGVHVATEYQDGIIQRQWKPGEKQGRLGKL
ncbi:Thioesterase/thiol ester dehydrase-isomerase [Hypoxylon rubiginosum]|uniref:Thioesterase/thiol ester dehydrase-isomerase n=1 Tax=Hypoxylon rubiginosum TaxID=110542 RepID=A0ACC0DNL4_9PEZI|nr:Thioesterase/thiol ester dehydrase-isomerase [Hypoxylon rubiginosum]